MNKTNTVVLEGDPRYLVYFDNQDVTKYIIGFSTDSNINGTPSSATIQAVYTRPFMDIDYLTDVKIFSKNIFSGKYKMIFDGQIHARGLSFNQTTRTISFTALDNMYWLQRMPVPMLFGVEDSVDPLVTFQWLAKGINFDKVKTILTSGELSVANKNLNDTLTEVFARINDAISWHAGDNKIDKNSIYHWVNLSNRLKILSDIDKSLRENNYIDMFFQGALMENLYVFINGIVSKLGYEFYQDNDGIIKIKEPYWNEGILKNFIIDPVICTDMSESTNWDNRFTRILVTGGIESALMRNMKTTQEVHQLTPAGVYVGDQSGTGFFTSTKNTFLPTQGTDKSVKQLPTISVDAGRNAIASHCLRAVGRPYDLGGNDPFTSRGVDCSGLIFWSYNQAGYKIQDAGATSYYATAVKTSLNNLQPGDLGFLMQGNSNTQTQHVGIYCGVVDGMYTWVHAKGKQYGVVKLQSATNKNVGGWQRYGDLVSTIADGYTGLGTISVPNGTSYTKLTQLTDLERRYGVSVYETDQPLVRVGLYTQDAFQDKAYGYLQDYCKYMYSLLNASSNTSSVSLISAPWLRPGYNLWFDPSGLSRVYYINNVRHVGDARGVYTYLGLTYGRSEEEYSATYAKVGNAKSNPFTLKNNINSSEYFVEPTVSEPFTVVKPSNFSSFKAYVDKIQASCNNVGSIPAEESPYREWYGKDFIPRDDVYLNIWDAEYTPLEIKLLVKSLYEKNIIVNYNNTTGLLNEVIESEAPVSQYAREAIKFNLKNSDPPVIIKGSSTYKGRIQDLADILVKSEEEFNGRYLADQIKY